MRYRLLIIAVLLLCVGCIKDSIVEPYVDGSDHLFTLSIEQFSDEVVGTTRSATSAISIDRGYLFFYNSSSGTFKGYEAVEDVNLKQNGSTITFDAGTKYSITDKVIAIFNHDVNAALPADFTKVTSENIESYFPLSSAYLSKVEEEMNSGVYSLGMPMYLDDFTDSDRAVREVYRSVARMELFIKEDLTIEHDSHTHPIGSTSLSYMIVNAASVGSVDLGVSPTYYSAGSCFDVDNFDGTFPHSLTEYESSAGDTDNKVYLHPFPYSTLSVDGSELYEGGFSEERFAIIIRHGDKNIYPDRPESEYRYYKLNLLDKATSTYFDVKRNHSYKVVIKAVNSRGYATVKEAYEMPPSNIEYEIYDDKGGFTHSNGQYAISMDEILSYDEILVYGSNEATLEFNNIRYVLPYEGQMQDADFKTNKVSFEVLSDTDGLIIDTTNDFDPDGDGEGVLTSEGQSITVTLSGEGECSIALRIVLGNLEMGRDEIKIKKVATNGDGDGSFDAHPNHIELKGQKFVDGSWHSDDADFGARASSKDYDDADGGTVIYMGENVTPTGYKTMDGYVSGQHALDSYPVFSPKTRRGYYAYEDSKGETRKVMIQLEQLPPFYLGHFGSTASSESTYHYDALICEKIEEIPLLDNNKTVLSQTGGISRWAEGNETFYQGTIWGDYLGIGDRYLNLVEGLEITKSIVNNPNTTTRPTAADYCYMKNDINGNGKIDNGETINWYLPAQNQMLAMWININVFDEDNGQYGLHSSGTYPYYWTSTEVDDIYDFTGIERPNDFSSYVSKFNMIEGQSDFGNKYVSWDGEKWHIRCVRGL